MFVEHAASVAFYFEVLLHRSSLPLLDKGHVTLLFFICNRHLLHDSRTLKIFEQSLGLYHFFCVFIVSHEEGIVLLFLRAFVALVVRLAY